MAMRPLTEQAPPGWPARWSKGRRCHEAGCAASKRAGDMLRLWRSYLSQRLKNLKRWIAPRSRAKQFSRANCLEDFLGELSEIFERMNQLRYCISQCIRTARLTTPKSLQRAGLRHSHLAGTLFPQSSASTLRAKTSKTRVGKPYHRISTRLLGFHEFLVNERYGSEIRSCRQTIETKPKPPCSMRPRI